MAGLTLGVGVVDLTGVAAPAYAAPADAPVLQPIADTPVAVLSGDGAAPSAMPRQLAVRVVRSAALPVGARIAITFDPRRYVALTPAVVTLAGRPIAATRTIVTDPGTGQDTSVITLTETVPAGGDLIAVVGTAHPQPYPDDLQRHTPDPTARIRRSAAATESRRPLRPARPSTFGGPALPWGIEIDAVWGGDTWGDSGRFCYPVPVRVTLRSVGPGPAPATVAFAVSVDPRLVSSIEVASAQLNYHRFGGHIRRSTPVRTPSLLRLGWRVPVRLGPGEVLDVYLKVGTVRPDGELTGLKHPVVALLPAVAAASQRRTGRETVTRGDAVCAVAADG